MTDAKTFTAGFATALALSLLALFGAQRAEASTSQTTIFDAPSGLLGAPSVDARNDSLDRIAALGTDTVRIVVPWRFLAPAFGSPTIPANFNGANPREYDQNAWAGLDASVAGIQARGMKALLTPSSPFPNWASASGKSKLISPKPLLYQDFVTAMARRYSGDYRIDPGKACPPGSVLPGTPILDPYLQPLFCTPRAPSAPLPRVTDWAIWNEPNQTLFLRPQFKGGKAYSPTLYRSLFLAGQNGLAIAGHSTDKVFIGETAPSGGRDGVNPIDFMRGVFCLDAKYKRDKKCAPIQAAGWAHHPYSPGVAPFRTADNPGLINVANIAKLSAALKRAGSKGATKGKLKIYVTEFGVQTIPDKKFGVSLKNQAGYLAIAEYLLYSNPAVKSYSQYLLRDDSLKQASPFTTGLQTNSGKDKPAYSAFPVTLLAKSLGPKRVKLWGHVRPGTGKRTVTVSYKQKGKTKKLKTLKTNPRGYFTFGSANGDGRTWAAAAKVDGVKLQGPFLPAFTF